MLNLVMTCTSCPEQYYAYLGNQRVGYLRLRHGYFYAQLMDAHATTVYSTEDIDGDGSFASDEERHRELTRASIAILNGLMGRLDAPNISIYELGTTPAGVSE